MRLLAGIGRFVYDFVIGDDWKIAAAVVLALACGAMLVAIDVTQWVVATVTAAAIAAGFSTAMIIDVYGGSRRGSDPS